MELLLFFFLWKTGINVTFYVAKYKSGALKFLMPNAFAVSRDFIAVNFFISRNCLYGREHTIYINIYEDIMV